MLQEHFEVEVFEGDQLITKDTLLQKVTDVDAIISPLSTNIDKEIIDQAPNLKSSQIMVLVSITLTLNMREKKE